MHEVATLESPVQLRSGSFAGVAQSAERDPSKFEAAGANPATRFCSRGQAARQRSSKPQSVGANPTGSIRGSSSAGERLVCNQGVEGANPSCSMTASSRVPSSTAEPPAFNRIGQGANPWGPIAASSRGPASFPSSCRAWGTFRAAARGSRPCTGCAPARAEARSRRSTEQVELLCTPSSTYRPPCLATNQSVVSWDRSPAPAGARPAPLQRAGSLPRTPH